MKKFLVVALIMFGSLYAQQAVNLIYNPGFEVWDTSSTGQDSMPRFWHFFTRSVLCSGYVAKTNGYQGFGAKLVVIGDTSGYDASFYHYINGIDTLPFADDTFLVYMRVRENSAKISGRFYAYWLDSLGNPVGSAVSSSYTVNSEDWQEVYVKTLRPSGAVTFKFDFRIYKYSTDEDSIIVDDAYFGPFLSSVSEESRFDLTIPKLVYSVLNLEFGQISPLEISLSLYDATGRFLQNLYKGRVVSRSMSFDMSNLNRGIYFIFVESAAERKVYRIIKL
ncbi:MAG: T9SS type A sorting domain-containing protein [candidate division WOR-3 bacterium]